MPKVELTVNGQIFSGWTRVSVGRAIDAASGAFSLELTEKYPGQDKPWVIEQGDDCTVALDGEIVIAGRVDTIGSSFDANTARLSIAGRDKVADAVDCSAVHTPGEWSNIRLGRVLSILAAPFGVSVSVEVDQGEAFSKFAVRPGETAFAAMDRAARMRGVLLVPDGAGGIIVTRPGESRAQDALVEGKNILSGEATRDNRRRHSVYIVRGQSAGTDFNFGDGAALVEGRATDKAVERYRPLIVNAASGVDNATAAKSAQWEATVRAARALSARVTVQGWRQSGGQLWTPNRRVSVKSPRLRMDGDAIISQVQYVYGEGGTLATLTLVPPGAFEPKPEIPKQSGGATVAWNLE